LTKNRKKMVICGATGFIGRNLVEYYSEQGEYDITAIYNIRKPYATNDNVTWVKANLNNPEDVKMALSGASVVLQFAATTSGSKDITTRPHIHVTDNAVMNSLLLRECYEIGVEHFVFPSCTVMYQPNQEPISENDFDAREELLSKYFGVGNTKVYIEKMCDFYSRFRKTKHTVIRHSNIYGPYDKYDLERSHVFGATVAKVMTADKHITVWGDGSEGRDLLHVGDLVRFVDCAINRQEEYYKLYNVGCGYATTIKNLVEKIIKASGRELNIEFDLSKPTIKTTVCLNCKKAEQELGWKPLVSLEEGINKVIKWYRESF